MTLILSHLGYMLVGFLLHSLMKANELDSRTPEHDVFFKDVVWVGAERYKTIALLIFMIVVAASGQAYAVLAAVGITVTAETGMVIILMVVGWDCDSVMQKFMALGHTKE